MALTDAGKYGERWLERLIRSDADRMAHRAQVVFEIAPYGSVREYRHPDGANIIAVLGELELAGHRYPRALLLEIGIGRGKPYTELSDVAFARRHFASIPADAYERVAPHLFRIMQELSDATVKRWRHAHITLKCPRARYAGSLFHEHEKRSFTSDRGKRFSVSCDDTLLLGDLCWSHLFALHQSFKKFVNFIDGSLACLNEKAKKRFAEEWLPLELAERMRVLGPYALIALERVATQTAVQERNPVKEHYPNQIADAIKKALGASEPFEFALACAAKHSGAYQRLGSFRVYDATWRRPRCHMSVRTFEILPSHCDAQEVS